MADPNLEDAGTSPETAVQQQGDRAWPVPGDEGYVHPDGTPQSIAQMEGNRRAAADRAAAGSIIHGAPAATPGPQLHDQAAAAVKRAENYSGPTTADAREGLTKSVKDGFQAAADKAAESDQPETASAVTNDPTPDAGKRTATTKGSTTTR